MPTTTTEWLILIVIAVILYFIWKQNKKRGQAT